MADGYLTAKRLVAKGLVKRDKGPVGKAFVYKPLRRPEKTYRRVVNDMLQRIFGGNGIALVTSLFETQPPTRDEVDQLQRLLDQLRRQREHNEGSDPLEGERI